MSMIFLGMLGLGMLVVAGIVVAIVVLARGRAPGLRLEHLIDENRRLREEIERLRRGGAAREPSGEDQE